MKADLAKISMMDEFAQYAKTERKINKLTEKLNQCSSARSLQVIGPIYGKKTLTVITLNTGLQGELGVHTEHACLPRLLGFRTILKIMFLLPID